MSKRHRYGLKLKDLRKMCNAVCEMCDMRFADTRRFSIVEYPVLYDGFVVKYMRTSIESSESNMTVRYYAIVNEISRRKDDCFYRNLFKGVPAFSSPDELKFKLTVMGVLT